MKNSLTHLLHFKSLNFILFFFMILSCDKDDIISSSSTYFTFFGLKIDLKQTTLSEIDLKNYEKKEEYSPTEYLKSLRIDGEKDFQNVSLEKYYSWVENEIKKFPDLEKDLPSRSDLQFFKKIFPEINTEEDYQKYKFVLLDYTNLVISKNLEIVLKTNLLKKSNNRPSHNDDGSLNLAEIANTQADPVYSLKVKNSGAEADSMLKQIFGSSVVLSNNDNVNAMRHAAWNMCSVSKIAQASGNKWKGLQKAEIIITAHEYKNNSTNNGVIPRDNYTTVMDGYNNLVGRTYCYNTIGQTWLGNANNIPSYSTIKTAIQTFSVVTVTGSSNVYFLATPVLTNTNILGLNDVAFDYGNNSISQKLVRY